MQTLWRHPRSYLVRDFRILNRNSWRNTVSDRRLSGDHFEVAAVTALQAVLVPLVTGPFDEQITFTPGATLELPLGHLHHLVSVVERASHARRTNDITSLMLRRC